MIVLYDIHIFRLVKVRAAGVTSVSMEFWKGSDEDLVSFKKMLTPKPSWDERTNSYRRLPDSSLSQELAFGFSADA